jgi:osmoprotectant transport system ATP-binding protein
MADNAQGRAHKEQAVIKLENVWKVYADGTEAVKDVSLEINEGEFCIFLGPSGCGKTTSLKMINRLIPLSRGKIYVNGVETMKVNSNELRRDIGYAIQNIGLFPHLTVEQNIATVPRLKKWPKARQRSRAEELLNLVGMDPATFIDRYPSELSGGQQQRIGVARCLGADPPILLMDEPFGAIDPITRTKLQDEFLKIQAKIKKTIAFVTHDIHEAIKMGDRIALMKSGELIQYTDPTTLLQQPKDKFVRPDLEEPAAEPRPGCHAAAAVDNQSRRRSSTGKGTYGEGGHHLVDAHGRGQSFSRLDYQRRPRPGALAARYHETADGHGCAGDTAQRRAFNDAV